MSNLGATCNFEEAESALRYIHMAATSTQLISRVEEKAAEMLRACHATFFILEQEQGQEKVARLICIRNEKKVSIPVSQGIAGQIADEGGHYICNGPTHDALYVEEIDGLPHTAVENLISFGATFNDEPIGVIQVVNKQAGSFTDNDAFWLQSLADHAAIAYKRLQKLESGWDLVKQFAHVIANAVDEKHVSTVGHTDRTRQIALAVGREMNLTDDELIELDLAAALHDLGRIGLSPEAFEWAGGHGNDRNYAASNEQLHLVLTEAILKHLHFPPFLENLPEIALSHHECHDGSGYPRGKRSAELPLGARILIVANAFDMLTSGRMYELDGKRLSDAEAVQYIKRKAGVAYDPAVVDKLVRHELYKIDKRRFPRYDFEVPLEIAVLGEAHVKDDEGETNVAAECIETSALDLSEGGLLFRSKHKLPDHALLKMKIHLPNETLDALARVARHLPDENGSFRVGAYFLWYGNQGA